jgi:propanol-preferring alcohol dehydrogenase
MTSNNKAHNNDEGSASSPTMKAFRFNEANSDLQLCDVPRPTPGPSEVLIQVKAAGLCHSDCIIMEDENYGMIMQRPLTLGHEVAGVIIEIGSEIEGYKIGDQIACAQISQPATIENWSNAIGLAYDGGYAEFAIVRANNITRIPEGVTFAQAAVATDSVATAYHAVVTEGPVKPGETVAVVGLGGLGLSAVRIAHLEGAVVYGVDLETGKFAEAKEIGARDCSSSLSNFKDIEFDIIFDFAGAGVTTSDAALAVKPGGKVVLVGIAAKETTLNTLNLIMRRITLAGSLGATKDDLDEVLELIASKQLTPLTTEIPFLDVPKGLAELNGSKVTGRLFTDPSLLRP